MHDEYHSVGYHIVSKVSTQYTDISKYRTGAEPCVYAMHNEYPVVLGYCFEIFHILYRYIERFWPSISWHPRVFYAFVMLTLNESPHVSNIEIVYIDSYFFIVGIVLNPIPVNYPTLSNKETPRPQDWTGQNIKSVEFTYVK